MAKTLTNKKSLSIRYSCQFGEDKDVFKSLSNDEYKQLSTIVKKLVNNGVKLQITYSEINKD